MLIVLTAPAHSLADALGEGLGPEARRIRSAPGELYAAELDADRALGRWLRARDKAFHTIATRGTYLDDEDVDRLLSLSFPGVDELVGLVELTRLADVRPYEVIIDTAPTGHTLRLLEMPETLARLAQVLDDMHEKHRFLATSLGGAWRPDFADEVIDEIAREATSLRSLLTDRTRTSFTWVTLPEELPVLESEDAGRALSRLGVAIGAVVINRVWPLPDRACARCIDCVRGRAPVAATDRSHLRGHPNRRCAGAARRAARSERAPRAGALRPQGRGAAGAAARDRATGAVTARARASLADPVVGRARALRR